MDSPDEERIAVVGLGYVGLPVAVAFAARWPGTVGFDTNENKVAVLRKGLDPTGEVGSEGLVSSGLSITSNPDDLASASFFIVAVPTPIDGDRRPDLGALRAASETVGRCLKRGAVVVYESTVYPGVTEEVCGPILEEASGLRRGVDFTLGYSPERINPGDREHSFSRIVKVVSGEDEETLRRVSRMYSSVVEAGVHEAPSIRVAEAAKVIENTQRDLNIALMNELAVIFDRLDIDTRDVLKAAGTKWNFLPFSPGLVGGHCIGVDPYYLTAKAESVGYHPEVILAGRRINDGMGRFVAGKLVKLLIQAGGAIKGSRVGVLGLTFKENVPDVRNSRVPDIMRELLDFGMDIFVHDPIADHSEAGAGLGVEVSDPLGWPPLDGLVLAVPHRAYLEGGLKPILEKVRPGGVLMDVKSAVDGGVLPSQLVHWRL
ncbi:MAG TPA: nucleotide sugar dehydrogenase [Gammaproteobacteria bacterium]|nr:nucleotide sugar dehydrogenase [Gammaproteobacteria bacterium]